MSEKFFLHENGKDEKSLYVVKYRYKDHNDEILNDVWLIALNADSQLHNFMDANKRSFKTAGLELMDYSYTRRTKTDNNYKITFQGIYKGEVGNE